MIHFFKDSFSDYAYASLIQTLILIAFVIFFVWILYTVLNKPKNYYKEDAEMPLHDDDPMM